VFGTDGLDVPIREIARHAEVAWRSTLDEGLADPDPWHGFRLVVEKLCELQIRDHGFIAAVKSSYPRAMDFAAIRTSSLTSAAELIRRAKETGRLRPEVVLNDVILMITAGGGILESAPAARIAASRRFDRWDHRQSRPMRQQRAQSPMNPAVISIQVDVAAADHGDDVTAVEAVAVFQDGSDAEGG
jgi:hypothetical protein